jgi:isoleucyl-tRNA synthetase
MFSNLTRQGVNVGEQMEYVLVATEDKQLLVVAEARREALSEKLGRLEVVAQLSGEADFLDLG